MRYPNATKEELTAPPAQYRVLGVETHSNAESVFSIGDFNSLDAAKRRRKPVPRSSSTTTAQNSSCATEAGTREAVLRA